MNRCVTYATRSPAFTLSHHELLLIGFLGSWTSALRNSLKFADVKGGGAWIIGPIGE